MNHEDALEESQKWNQKVCDANIRLSSLVTKYMGKDYVQSLRSERIHAEKKRAYYLKLATQQKKQR